jgi:hypothetical protein
MVNLQKKVLGLGVVDQDCILAIQEVEIQRIAVGSQPGEIVCE